MSKDAYDIVLQNLLDVTHEEFVKMYKDTNVGVITNNSYGGVFKEINTIEELKEVAENGYRFHIGNQVIFNFFSRCMAQKDEEVRNTFFKSIDSLFGLIFSGMFNQIIEKNTAYPERVLDLIAHAPSSLGVVGRENIEKTIDLLMNKMPQPEGKDSLVLYLYKQKDNIQNSSHLEEVQNIIVHALKTHASDYLEEFSFLPYVKKHIEIEKIESLFGHDEIEKTLVLKVNYENIKNYLGIKNLTIKTIKEWFKGSVVSVLVNQDNSYGVHSVSLADNKILNLTSSTSDEQTLYVNTYKSAALTQEMLTKSFNQLIKKIKLSNAQDLSKSLPSEFFPSFWLQEKMDKSLVHNETAFKSKNKI